MNSAYRGESSRKGWTTEADYIDGQRTDAATLAEDLDADPRARLLLLREAGELVGTVWLEPVADSGVWYLGMLTVNPERQSGGVGRRLLTGAEDWVRAAGGTRIRMTVVSIRSTLIAWYQRRGYVLTGETRPFPYGDASIGQPRRDDLEFVVMEKAL